jgi:hypothetical protein
LAVVFLSRYSGIGIFYTFGYVWPDIGPDWNCAPTTDFEIQALCFWSWSPKQVKMIKEGRCAGWQYMKQSLFVNPYHGKNGTPFHFWVSFRDISFLHCHLLLLSDPAIGHLLSSP